jgi:RHS repeat-associated protein
VRRAWRLRGMTGYQYDAVGQRVGKGTITSMSCDITANGYQPTNDYVLDQSGGQMTELAVDENGTVAWQHTNVKADGRLIATYDLTGLHFYLNDPLGTRRAQTDSAGVLEQNCLSLPFGDQLNCTISTSGPTEHHFTGKERDAESGLDYFGARYYASNMGRFMSPDWSASIQPVPYAKLGDPQSLNLYGYMLNSPLGGVDSDGHACSSLIGTAGSSYCHRAREYMTLDAMVGNQTRFFAATSAVSQVLADTAVPALPLFGRYPISKSTQAFLDNVGVNLEQFNIRTAFSIKQNPSLGGPNLDRAMVHAEQMIVQGLIDDLRQSDPGKYATTMSEINELLNPTGFSKFFATRFPTDKASAGVLDEVRRGLGRDINFANQDDREAKGNHYVDHIEKTGGKDVTGDKVQ